MADPTTAALAATLLGLNRKRDPLEIYQSFGKQQLAAGSSAAPLGSGNALEGIARALQGGIGGFVQGYGIGKENERATNTVDFLGKFSNAKDDAERGGLIQNYKGDVETIAPIIAQYLGQKQQREALAAGANSFGGGGGTPAAAHQASGPPVQLGPYQQTLSGAESGNNPQAVNPQSGAGGRFQFIPSTWEETRRANPGLNLPPTVAQATDEQQAKAEEAFRNTNAMSLNSAGFQPTAANLYLAHRAGAKGAQTILSAPPETPMASIVPPIWLEQNPDMRTTAGQFVAQAQKRFGGGPATPGQVNPSQIAQPPAVPAMPNPAPTPQEWATIQQQYAQGVYGQTPQEAGPRAQAALDALVEKRIGREETRTKMGYEAATGDYRATRDQNLRQPQETIQNESNARNQFDNLQPVKDYRKAHGVFDSAVKDYKTNTAAADLNLIYGFATMMDPGSVVHEGEKTMIQGTSSIADQARGMIAALEGEGRLSQTARANLMDQMASRYNALRGIHDQLGEAFGGIAQRSGMNRENVVIPLERVPYERRTTAPSGPAANDIKKKYGLE